MKLLLLGANGQVGWELQRALSPLGQLKACDSTTADLNDFAKLTALVRAYKPTHIINAAAYTAVDLAEKEPDKAERINATAVKLLAEEAKRLDAWLVHYSTDYVFDGRKTGSYIETDANNPLSTYGLSKLNGENAILASGCKHLIFRTSWVYAAHGANFARTMLRLAQEKSELNIVADQFGAPTSAELIADVTAHCLYRLAHDAELEKMASGLYHLVASGETNWHGYAQQLIAAAQESGATLRATAEDVHPIPTDQYPLPATRPANSRLNTQKLADTFNVYLPPWQQHLKRLVSELVSQGHL